MNKISSSKTKLKQKIDSLERQSKIVRGELEEELEVAKGKATDFGKIALGIGVGLIFSAILLKGLGGKKGINNNAYSKHRSGRVYQRFMDQLLHEFSNQATRFLLGVAKDKLNLYAQNKEKAGDDDFEITG